MALIGAFFRTLFSTIGALIAIYILIGVFHNTAPPHFPHQTATIGGNIHSWTQYIISVFGWPISYIQPQINFGKWTG